MKSINLKSYVCIAVMILLAACIPSVIAAQDEILDPALITYTDSIVIVTIITDLEAAEAEALFIFTDNSLFTSEEVFKLMFTISVNAYDIGEITFTRIKGFGTVNGAGFFGEWTPDGGFTYYPLEE